MSELRIIERIVNQLFWLQRESMGLDSSEPIYITEVKLMLQSVGVSFERRGREFLTYIDCEDISTNPQSHYIRNLLELAMDEPLFDKNETSWQELEELKSNYGQPNLDDGF